MRVVTATDASRGFASLLDQVEAGETVILTRAGKRIAMITPTGTSNGAAVRALLGDRSADPGFAKDVAAARSAARADSPAWPGD